MCIRDRPSESTHDPTTNLGCSDTNCCARPWQQPLSEESTNQAETDAAGDVPNTIRTENIREKATNTVFNEVQKRAYGLEARDR